MSKQGRRNFYRTLKGYFFCVLITPFQDFGHVHLIAQIYIFFFCFQNFNPRSAALHEFNPIIIISQMGVGKIQEGKILQVLCGKKPIINKITDQFCRPGLSRITHSYKTAPPNEFFAHKIRHDWSC
jgi:hypothetical protein